MRQTGAGEHGQLLTAHERVQAVDGGNARLNELGRIVARCGVHRVAIDVKALFGNQRGAIVLRAAHAIEHAAEHIGRHGQLDGAAKETRLGIGDFKALRTFKELQERAVAVDLQHAAVADLAVLLLDLDQLVVLNAFDVLHHHQRARDFLNRTVFLTHPRFLPRSACGSQRQARSWSPHNAARTRLPAHT